MADTGTPSVTTSVETIAGQITAAPHNTNYGDLSTKFNAHTHDLASDCVGDTELDAQRVRSVHATKKYALVSGRKSFTASGTSDSVTITFATDADQGDPGFTANPRFVAYVIAVTGVGGYAYAYALEPYTTDEIHVSVIWASAESGPAFIDWFAYGEVA
jgi:hypothetical protein